MTGSLQSYRGKYYAVLNLKDIHGKRKQKKICLQLEAKSGNKRQAEKALREILVTYERNHMDIVRPTVLFCDYIRVWLEETKIAVELSTYEGYKNMIDKHIYPYFESLGISLDNLRYHHLQKYYGTKIGSLSANTIRKHHIIMNQTLKKALKHDLIANNPADKVTLPKVEKFVGKFLSVDEGSKLLEVSKDSPMHIVIVLAMTYGLRRSEIAGLKWKAVDFENDTIHICHTITKMKTKIAKDRTKNSSSNRILPLNGQVRNQLVKLQEAQQTDKKILGKTYHNTDYICRWADGRELSTEYMSHAFKNLLKKHGLPDVRFHDLRHSCASYMLKMGCSMKEISDWLGHSNIQTSMNIYTHLDIEQKKNVADKFNTAFTI